MDRRLLGYYNRELAHLREMGAEFAREFPKIAGRLALEDFSCADPYVERLLEGFAFLTSRVQLKLDAEFPRFTQSLLETLYPHYIAPTKAALRLRLAASPTIPFSKMKMDRLGIFIRGAGDVAMRVYEQIFGHGVGIVVQPKGKPVKWREVIKGNQIRPIGFEENEALLPFGARS